MTFREFLDSAYALLVEMWQKLGMNLLDALEKTGEWAVGGKPEPTAATEARDNDRAFADFQKLMRGVS